MQSGSWRVALLVLSAVACSGSAEDTPGVGGSGGSAGRGGSAGSGGSAGQAGAAGSGGSAGDAGAGGRAGSSSAPDAGAPEPEADAGGGPPVVVGPVDKLDVLFMIDNSISMTDKQSILRVAVPDLVSRLTNPICIDDGGNEFPAAAPGEPCPAGQRREFEPLLDIHIGVVSSSLGDAGANVACPPEGFPTFVPDRIDMAHLLGSLPRGQNSAATPAGFLAWSAGSDASEFSDALGQMVNDVGESGCGFEAQLESWYRFLVDPFPYQGLVRVQCPGSTSTQLNCVQQATSADSRILLDEALLEQRAAFLRPDSMVAVVMLSDENDCSLQIGNQTWVVAAIDDTRPMFRGSSTCAIDPNDKCCFSCPLGPPEGCPADPICAADPANGVLQNRLPADQDGTSLRCFDQKRRFGVDFLYPTQRYVNALSQRALCWNALDLSVEGCSAEDVYANPLYAGGRPSERVFVAGIVGVPWQAIASSVDAAGEPLPAEQLRFQNATELDENDTWSAILGSTGVRWRPATGALPEVLSVPAVPPSLPQMVESSEARPGVLAGNPINGREFDTRDGQAAAPPNDLQYACIFPLPEPRDCTERDPAIDACDCFEGALDRPLCEQVPGSSEPGTTQYWGKAYPAGRHLEVLKGLGPNGIVASICARNTSDQTAADFGYRPAVAALIERIRTQLP